MRVGELITNGNERRSETRMRAERGRCNEMVTRRRETRERKRERGDALFHRRVCSGPVGFLGSLRFRYGGGRGIQTGGKQVARDEQGVLHGHYARSCPSHNPDPARTLLYSHCCSSRFYITTRERERERRRTRRGLQLYIGKSFQPLRIRAYTHESFV